MLFNLKIQIAAKVQTKTYNYKSQFEHRIRSEVG